MERELVAIFFISEIKEILTRYSKTNLIALKDWMISKI
jgi:hypothetical protein